MSVYLALLLLLLFILTGFAFYHLGGRVQRSKDVDAHLARLKRVREVENNARTVLMGKLEELEGKKRELRKLAWEDLLRELKDK